MSKKEQFFAIIPIHGRNTVVEGENVSELQQGIDQALEGPEASFPVYDFRGKITVIKGRRVTIPIQGKPAPQR